MFCTDFTCTTLLQKHDKDSFIIIITCKPFCKLHMIKFKFDFAAQFFIYTFESFSKLCYQ